MNQINPSAPRRINPPGLFDGAGHGMSQAVIDPATGLAFISGQVAWDEQAQVRGQGYGEQTKMALDNVGRALKAVGASVADMLHVRIYVRGELSEHMEQIIPPFREFLDGERPAVTGVGVASLATPDTLVEIEVVARASA